ncbi:MAG: BTAD domain-containing putative transcriptional regulator [Actinomycetota bacterium]
MAKLTINLLGAPDVQRDGVPTPSPKGKKVWALLAFLIRSDTPVSRERLASLLFADADDPLGALRWNLAELKRLLGVKDILRGEPIALSLPPGTEVDVEGITKGTWRQAMSIGTIGGTLLEGLSFPKLPSFETWLLTERRHLANASASVMREAALGRIAAGAPEDAIKLARKLVEIDPLDESYQALLIRSLAASGDRRGARSQLEATRALLMKELGVEPGRAAVAAGAVDAGLESLRQAATEAQVVGDSALEAQALFALGSSLIHTPRGRDMEGSVVLHQAIDVASKAGLANLVAGARRELGYVELLAGRYDRARGWLDQALEAVDDDIAEEAAIRTVLGACWSDTAHYPDAFVELEKAIALADEAAVAKQISFASAFLGRAQLLTGAVSEARETMLRSKELAEQEGWTSFVAWPEALLGDCMLADGDVDEAADLYQHAFTLGCHFADPCWEGMAARGIGLVKSLRGDPEEAIDWLDDARTRCVRIADAYIWVEAYCQDALCEVAIAQGFEGASRFVDELEQRAASTGMREYVAKAYVHRYRLGEEKALDAARVLASGVANPALHEMLRAAGVVEAAL